MGQGVMAMAKSLTANGPVLRKLREDAWLDRKELAKMAGVAEHTIMRIELGDTLHPFRTTLRKIAKALDVHPDELIIKRDEPEVGRGPLGHVSRPLRFRAASVSYSG